MAPSTPQDPALAACQQNATSLATQLAARDATITRLQQEKSELAATLTGARVQMQRTEAALATTEGQLEDLQATVAALVEQLEAARLANGACRSAPLCTRSPTHCLVSARGPQSGRCWLRSAL